MDKVSVFESSDFGELRIIVDPKGDDYYGDDRYYGDGPQMRRGRGRGRGRSY